jgi:DNA-binding LacI/PurR family transcriptional regulator
MAIQVKSKVTIQDLAKIAGVAKSTVSDVLNERKSGTRVSQKTREKILGIAEKLNYTPQASARALSTGKTYNIGFLLSSKVTLGLANAYFSTIMAGVQQACMEQNYNCTVSTYDLSTIDNFVMPSKLRQRSVDGVVITGQVESKVVEMFIEKQIPFVMVGDTTDFPLRGILAVACDIVMNWVNILKYLTELGHRHILIPGYFDGRSRELLHKGKEIFQKNNPSVPLNIEMPILERIEENQFKVAFEAGEAWAGSDARCRATAVVSNDQWCLGFLSAVQRCGGACPKDLSIICHGDTSICEWFNPAVTAVNMNLFDYGYEASALLIDLLEGRISLADAYRRTADSWKPGKLIVRESTGVVPVK